jgi:hypothetical protein
MKGDEEIVTVQVHPGVRTILLSSVQLTKLEGEGRLWPSARHKKSEEVSFHDKQAISIARGRELPVEKKERLDEEPIG